MVNPKPDRDFHWENILGTPSFPLAAKTPGLQAADFLAYSMYEHTTKLLADGVTGSDLYSVKPPPLIGRLLKNRHAPNSVQLLGLDAIQEAVETVRARNARPAGSF